MYKFKNTKSALENHVQTPELFHRAISTVAFWTLQNKQTKKPVPHPSRVEADVAQRIQLTGKASNIPHEPMEILSAHQACSFNFRKNWNGNKWSHQHSFPFISKQMHSGMNGTKQGFHFRTLSHCHSSFVVLKPNLNSWLQNGPVTPYSATHFMLSYDS